MTAGHCSACGLPIWRTGVAQKDKDGTKAGEVVLLWPDPASVYAKVQTPTGWTPGIAYCPGCAPPLGSPGPPEAGGGPIIGYEVAQERYAAWYTEDMGTWLRAWLADHLAYPGDEVQAFMDRWQSDRAHHRREEIAARRQDADDGLPPA